MGAEFTFGSILQIFFDHIASTPLVLADQYVLRDRTLIYKWMNDTAFPSRQLFPEIIRFVTEKTGESARPAMRKAIDQCIAGAALDPAQKQDIIGETDFSAYLEKVILALAMLKKRERDRSSPKATEEDTLDAPLQATAETVTAVPVEPEGYPHDMPSADRAIHITLSPKVWNAGLAIAACVAGDGLWAVFAWAAKWPDNLWMQTGVLPVFVCGVLFALPIVALAMISLRIGASVQQIGRGNTLLLAAAYAAAGGAGALLLTQSGLYVWLDAWPAAPEIKEILLLILSFLVLAFFPALAQLAVLRFPKVRAASFLMMEFGPALLGALLGLPFIIAGVSPIAPFWPGGFVAGAGVKLVMYLSSRHVLKIYSKRPIETGRLL